MDRHLKTLSRYLKNLTEETSDPRIIEKTSMQLKNIEKVHRVIKKAVHHKDMCASESSRVYDSIFTLNDEGEGGQRGGTQSQALSGRESLESTRKPPNPGPSNEFKVPVAP